MELLLLLIYIVGCAVMTAILILDREEYADIMYAYNYKAYPPPIVYVLGSWLTVICYITEKLRKK